MLEALIWDVDGTLAETEDEGHRVAFNLAFAEAGLDWHWDAALYGELLTVTGGKERMMAWWQRIDPAGAASDGAASTIARLHRLKTAHYLARVQRGDIALRPGVARLLREARREGVRLAIATTTTPENVTGLLEATLGPEDVSAFEVIGAGDVVPRKKPAPDIYDWVLQRLALPAGRCMALEDSRAGALAALAAGVPTVVTRSRYTAAEMLPEGLRADLDTLGEADRPGRGRAMGAAWVGCVDLPRLRAWHAVDTSAGARPTRRP